MIIHLFAKCRSSLERLGRVALGSGLALSLSGSLSLGAASCGARQGPPREPRPLDQALTTAGDSIYFGSVYPLRDDAVHPVFVYERRVAERASQHVSTHITRTPSGDIALADSAVHTADYELLDYTLHTNQWGQSGSIHVQGDEVTFQLDDGTEQRTASEHIDAPVAVGPTLVGYIVRRLDALRAGNVVPVRLAVLERLETLGFELEAMPADPAQTQIRMSPSSFLIGLLVAPISFTFETSSSKLLRLEGRVPPKLFENDSWHDLDARVEYRYLATAYR
jgi:hypothetical protein